VSAEFKKKRHKQIKTVIKFLNFILSFFIIIFIFISLEGNQKKGNLSRLIAADFSGINQSLKNFRMLEKL
jgi:hypothetical protein